jgi:peptide deformylase
VSLHDEDGCAGRRQAAEPRLQQLVQLGLADADRWVGPDQVVALCCVDVARCRDLDVVKTVAGGVGSAQQTGALVDIKRDDPGGRCAAGQREGDRTGAASKVEEHTRTGWRWCLTQEERRAGVEFSVAEHPAVRVQHEGWIDGVDDDLALGRNGLLALREVVRHAVFPGAAPPNPIAARLPGGRSVGRPSLAALTHAVDSLTSMSAPIRVFGDPVLKTKAVPVADIDGKAVRLVDDMFDSLYDCGNGLALAAPQIGVQKQVVVWDLGDDPQVIFNPEIVESDGEWVYEEGCLSIPGLYVELARPKTVLVRGIDLDGNPVEREADELEARMFQHELDHLNGVLMFDRMTPDQRRDAMAEYRRITEQSAQPAPNGERRRLRLR